jgi:hypothetical protein
MATSYKCEVQADSSGRWESNELRFATHQEATFYAVDLGMRWMAVREARVVESDDPVTHVWLNHAGAVHVPPPEEPVRLRDLPGGTPLTVVWRTE